MKIISSKNEISKIFYYFDRNEYVFSVLHVSDFVSIERKSLFFISDRGIEPFFTFL